MRNYSLLISKKLYIRNILVFIFFCAIFLLYHSRIEYGNFGILLFLNIMILLVFLLTAFKPKIGLYVFIFCIPLFNSVTTMLAIRSIDIPFYIFFGFFLGFLLSFFQKDFENKLGFLKSEYYDAEIKPAAFVLLGILVISLAVTVFRYANLYPFITNNYYTLKVNLNGVNSDSAIFWAIKYFFNYAIVFFFLFAVFNIIDKKRDIIISTMSLIFATGLSSVFAIYQHYFNPTLGSFRFWADSGRINSTFADPNALGAYCVIIFPVFLSLVIFSKRWYFRLVFFLLFILFMMMVVFSGSRTVLLAIFLTVFIFIIYGIARYVKYLKNASTRKKIINLSIILPLIFIIIVSFSVVIFTENQVKNNFVESELFKRTTMTYGTFVFHAKNVNLIEAFKSISNYRHIYWEQAMHMAIEYPVTGVGPGAYIIELPDYLQRFGKGFTEIDFSGNYYLQVLSELGLSGFIVVLFVFFLIIKKTFLYHSLKRKTGNLNLDDRLLFGIFVSYIITLVSLIFGPHTNFTAIQLTFWLIIAFILSYIKISQSQILSKIEPASIKNPDKSSAAISLKGPVVLSGSLKISLGQKISLAFILLLFFSSFILSSFTSLSIHAKQNRCYFENAYGFYGTENFEGKDISWISVDASTKLEKKGNTLILPLQDGYPFDDLGHLALPDPLVAKIYIDNLQVKSVKLENNSWYNVNIPIPDFTEDWFTLTIVLNRSWVPRDLELNFDTRELGARIGEYEFK